MRVRRSFAQQVEFLIIGPRSTSQSTTRRLFRGLAPRAEAESTETGRPFQSQQENSSSRNEPGSREPTCPHPP
jgi:hypothetical protein